MRFKRSAHGMLCVLTTVLCVHIQLSLARAAQDPETALVMVNDAVITQQDLAIETAQLRTEMQLRNRPMSDRQISALRDQLIQNLIDRELLYQRAQQKKIQIRNRWIDRSQAELKARLKNTLAYPSYLASTGLTEDQFKDRIRKGLIVRRLLRREVIRQIKVSEAEMQAFFRQHPNFFQHRERTRARHIMIAFDSQDKTSRRGDALLRIQSIQMMLQEGGNFASLALKYSDDPSKHSGGDLGYLERSQMIDAFADVAFNLRPGTISDIVETPFGYHLIQVIDRMPPAPMAYRHVRTKIERTLRRNKEKKAAEAYLVKLRRQAAISWPDGTR